MDTKTNEISNFENKQALLQALEKNPNLREVNCNPLCRFLLTIKGGKTFCGANRKQRRKIKCFKLAGKKPKEDTGD